MRARIFSILFGLLLPPLAGAQQAAFVTMTGTNANYANGTITANFFPPANSSQFDYLKYHFPFTVSAPLSAGGAWSISLGDTSSVLPASSQWRLQLCSAGTFGAPTCYSVTTAVTCINNVSCSGTTLDLSSSFSAAPVPPNGVTQDFAMSFLITGTISGTFTSDLFPALIHPLTVEAANVFVATAAVGCTTFPVIELLDVTASTALATATLVASTNAAAMTVSHAAVPAGDVIAARVNTAAVGCTTNASTAKINVLYH